MKGFQHDSVIITPQDDIVISHGAVFSRQAIRQLRQILDNTKLRTTSYLMTKEDYDDIVKWGKDV